MAKCAFCGQRKGKRPCPALGEVCSQCCGEHRQREIACPPDCAYLRPAEGGTGGAFGNAWRPMREFLLGDVDWGRKAAGALLGPDRCLPEWAQSLLFGWVSWGFVDEHGDRGVDRWIRARRDSMGAERPWVDVLRSVWHSLFRVAAVKRDIGLELEDLLTGKRHFVRERSATHDLTAGRAILGWIATFPAHEELAGATIDVPAGVAGEAERILRSAAHLEPGRDISPDDRRRTAAGIPEILKRMMAALPGARTGEGRAVTWEAAYEVRSNEKLRARLLESADLVAVEPGRLYRLLRRNGDGKGDGNGNGNGNGKAARTEGDTLGNVEVRTVRLSLRTRSFADLEEGKRAVEALLGDAIEHRLDRSIDADARLESVLLGENLALDPGSGPGSGPGSSKAPEETESVEAFDDAVGDLIRDWLREGGGARNERRGAAHGAARRRVPRPEGDRHALPPLGHEAVQRRVSGLREMCRETAARIARGARGLPPVLSPEELLDEPSVDRFLRRYLRSLQRDGVSGQGLVEEQVILANHIQSMVHHELHGRKTFWVDESLAWMLSETDLDISGSALRLPFPAFALVFTDPVTLEIAESLLSQEADCAIRGRPLRILTVYILRSPAIDPGISHLELCFVFDADCEKWPYLLSRELWVRPEANLAGILDSRPPDLKAHTVDSVFLQPEMKKLVHLCVNAILYSGSAHLDPILLGPRGAAPPASRAKPAPAGGRGGMAGGDQQAGKAQPEEETSAEEVFYLPGKIAISRVSDYRRLPSTESGRRILKRFLVRGHWRRPSASWSDQRLRWIEPYWKGPDLGRIIEKQYLMKP